MKKGEEMKKLLSFCFVILLVACVGTKPEHNANFGTIENISDLQGVYQNLGDGGSRIYPKYLSAIIWPKVEKLNHKAITSIEVKVTGPKTLLVTARTKEGIEKEEAFIEGKDFTITSGKISLKQKIRVAGFKDGEVIVGPYYESEALGLDSKGEGKYKQQEAVAGLVFAFLPFVMGNNDEVRFVRIDKEKNRKHSDHAQQ